MEDSEIKKEEIESDKKPTKEDVDRLIRYFVELAAGHPVSGS
jgi:hypothetical protein